jgi:hypothetical protein
VAVVPADRLLVVDRRLAGLPDRRRHMTLRLRWAGHALSRGLAVAMTFLGALVAGAWGLGRRIAVSVRALTAGGRRLSRRAWAAGAPAIAQTSRKGGSEVVRMGAGASRMVRSVPWQSYGRTAVRTSRKGGSKAIRMGAGASRTVRTVPWQSYGRTARSATTRLAQTRATRSSRRHTT